MSPTDNFLSPSQAIIKRLRGLGHDVQKSMFATAVQGIAREEDGYLWSNFDHRKNGKTDGL